MNDDLCIKYDEVVRLLEIEDATVGIQLQESPRQETSSETPKGIAVFAQQPMVIPGKNVTCIRPWKNRRILHFYPSNVELVSLNNISFIVFEYTYNS